MWPSDFGTAEISFVIIPKRVWFVKKNICIFCPFFGKTPIEVRVLKTKKALEVFLIGGTAYVGLEILWRGRSHSSMFAAGGLCFLLLGKLRRAKLHPAAKSVLGAGLITAVELGTGLLANRSFQVWDYRNMPANFKGQICLPYSLLWVPVSMAAMALHSTLEP